MVINNNCWEQKGNNYPVLTVLYLVKILYAYIIYSADCKDELMERVAYELLVRRTE